VDAGEYDGALLALAGLKRLCLEARAGHVFGYEEMLPAPAQGALAVECREGEHRVGGTRLENMMVVTKNGAEIMDYFPREEILVAPR
jgi:porphobilinogen deaminase